VLQLAYLNSHYQTGLKNLLDHAVLARVELQAELALDQAFQQDRRDPLRLPAPPHVGGGVAARRAHLLICKGAVEEVLAICTRVRGEAAGGPRAAGRCRHQARAGARVQCDAAGNDQACAWWRWR
jgi:Mg2+-importing ATPase